MRKKTPPISEKEKTKSLEGKFITETSEKILVKKVESSDDKLSTKEFIKIVLMPITIVLLTGILGTFLGLWLQNRSFRRNEIFRAKLDTITEGKKEAVKLLQDTEEVLRQVRGTQKVIKEKLTQLQFNTSELDTAKTQFCATSVLSPYMATLKKIKLRTAFVRDYTTEGNNITVNQKIIEFESKLDEYIRCGESDTCQICNDHADLVMDSLREVVASHTQMTNDLLREQEGNLLF
jgi:hypothetical protein